MKRFYLLSLMVASLFFVACGDSDEVDNIEPTPNHPTPPAEVKVGTPQNVSAMDGLERVKICWKVDASSEVKVTKTLIYSGTSSSYKEYPVASNGECEVIIEDLEEGEHTFQLANCDKDGNESAKVSISAKAYGEEFISELESRPFADWEYVKKEHKLIITWQEDWDKGLGTEVYLPNAGSEGTWVENDENITEIDGIEEGVALEIQTRYQPENCFDILYAKAYNIIAESHDQPSTTTLDINVMQLNVATGNLVTALTGSSHMWSDRCSKIVSMIKENNIDIIGLQELRDSPNYYYSNIMSSLGSAYSGVCYARSTYDKEGLAIVYRNDKFELISEGRYWLNMTDPDRELILSNGGYEANYYRIVVYAILREKSTGQEFYFTTAHLDNNDAGSGIIKTWQAQILINHTNARSGYDNGADRFIIVTGDMNSNPEREAMQRFTSSTQNYRDTWAEAENRYCPSSDIPRSTMVDIDGSTATQNAACFDYIFIKGGNPQVLSHTIHEAKSGEIIMSDHNAVSAVLRYVITK